MSVRIRLATSSMEVDSVFKLRHRVFAEQENLLKANKEKRLYDRFDAFPSSVQMFATYGENTIGAFRLSLDDHCGLPADEYFDFRSMVPSNARLMHTGMFCVDQDFRGEKIAMGLILMSAYYAVSNDVSHVVAPINPTIAPLLMRIGFKRVGEQFYDPHADVQVLPLLLDMKNLKDFFVEFIRQNQLHDFIMDYQRWFCKAGEKIVGANEEGQEAFIIIDGEAEVRLPASTEALATLTSGEMFGELAIITEEKRSADVIAKTDVQMMVMTKDIFLKRFVQDPEKALVLMKMISKRNQNMIAQLKYGQNIYESNEQ